MNIVQRTALLLTSTALSLTCTPTHTGSPSTKNPAPTSPWSILAQSPKRGAAYHFCGWRFSQGKADLDAMKERLAWYYNWSSRPLECPDGKGVANTTALQSGQVEFVPMVWGLVDDGEACESGGACFRVDERTGGGRCKDACEAVGWSFAPDGPCYACYHEPISRQAFLQDVPKGAKHLLGYNEPNFKEQANLTPQQAAAGWKHVQWVADQKSLNLVGPAVNYCDTTPGAQHPGACIEAVDGRAMLGFAWLETFYDACSAQGEAGFDCRIDHQAVHVYGCGGVTWALDVMKRKAGLLPTNEVHCTNGKQDYDEFGVDCGGNHCVACTQRARDLFAKPVWLTEFATPKGDCNTTDPQALQERTAEMMQRAVSKMEADPYVYRYAWFMPKTDLPDLDHADLLVEDKAGELSEIGKIYFALE